MKISTALSFQRSLNTMQETSAQVAKTREQLATGKEIVRPSDDTMKVSTIENLDRAIAKEDTYLALMGQLKDRYQLEETALTNGSDILVRVKELALQGANATLAAKDREIIAVEVQGLRDELLVSPILVTPPEILFSLAVTPKWWPFRLRMTAASYIMAMLVRRW